MGVRQFDGYLAISLQANKLQLPLKSDITGEVTANCSGLMRAVHSCLILETNQLNILRKGVVH